METPPPVPYRKLPGRTPTLRFGSVAVPQSSLWLGPDHLLKVEDTPTQQSYKRFEYRDIQEIFLQRTPRQLYLTIWFMVPVLLGSLLVYFSSEPGLQYFFIGALVLPFIGFIAWNYIASPTCDGYLRTAVGLEFLPSFSRWRPSARAVDLLAAEIERVQGVVAPT